MLQVLTALILLVPALALPHEGNQHDRRQGTPPEQKPQFPNCQVGANKPYVDIATGEKTYLKSSLGGDDWGQHSQQIYGDNNPVEDGKEIKIYVYEGEPDKPDGLRVGPDSSETDDYRKYWLKPGKFVHECTLTKPDPLNECVTHLFDAHKDPLNQGSLKCKKAEGPDPLPAKPDAGANPTGTEPLDFRKFSNTAKVPV